MPVRCEDDNVTVFVKHLAIYLPLAPAAATINRLRQQQQQQPATLCFAASVAIGLLQQQRRGATYRSRLATSHSTLHDLSFYLTLLNL